MILLIRNIPKNTYHAEIRALVEPIAKGGLLQKSGTVKNVEIIALQEENNTSLEYQALVNIEPELAASRVIKQLHGVFVRGHRMMVREYKTRSPENDKRKQDITGWSLTEKRNTGCRRRNLKVYKVAAPVFQ